jgi:hypothetical protein
VRLLIWSHKRKTSPELVMQIRVRNEQYTFVQYPAACFFFLCRSQILNSGTTHLAIRVCYHTSRTNPSHEFPASKTCQVPVTSINTRRIVHTVRQLLPDTLTRSHLSGAWHISVPVDVVLRSQKGTYLASLLRGDCMSHTSGLRTLSSIVNTYSIREHKL